MSKVVDLSFRSCSTISELVKKVGPKVSKNVVHGCVKVNNNQLSNLQGIKVLKEAAIGHSRLVWLDASFNQIVEITPEIIPELEHVKVLYLHGNKLKDLHGSLELLRKLPDLQSVTLNGNPLETTAEYRMTVLGALPNLRSIDHASVTAEERDRSHMWFGYSKHNHSSFFVI